MFFRTLPKNQILQDPQNYHRVKLPEFLYINLVYADTYASNSNLQINILHKIGLSVLSFVVNKKVIFFHRDKKYFKD